jgi:hypothetical protein
LKQQDHVRDRVLEYKAEVSDIRPHCSHHHMTDFLITKPGMCCSWRID